MGLFLRMDLSFRRKVAEKGRENKSIIAFVMGSVSVLDPNFLY